MEVPLPWERLLWSGRSFLRPSVRYLLTDLRLVRRDARAAAGSADEIVLEDIGEVRHAQTALDRLIGTSTIRVHARRGRSTIELRHVRRGAQLAALVELLAGDPQATLDQAGVNAALAWEPREDHRRPEPVLAGLAIVVAAVLGVTTVMRGDEVPPPVPSAEDPIAPGGVKRDRAAIVRFMETAVMPWARQALGPMVGGADQVTCATCHGDAGTRDWQMPAVAALPEPHVKARGWEIYSAGMDTQMRNAIYGYAAESDNQTRATYMREVVMPGMARLLHRPAYDFTRTYNYNRSRLSFGCYHCHRVN